MKIIAYSALFGKRDEIHRFEYENKNPDINYILFTDGEEHPDFKTIYTYPKFVDNRYSARLIKCLPHKFLPEHDYSIWFDSSFVPKKNISILVDEMKDYKIATFSHRSNYSWVQIILNCIMNHYDDLPIIEKQLIKYIKENLPITTAYETGILVRKNCKEISDLNELWWNELLHGSVRDQISFPYVLFKSKIECKLIGNNVIENDFFNHFQHGNSYFRRFDNPLLKNVRIY